MSTIMEEKGLEFHELHEYTHIFPLPWSYITIFTKSSFTVYIKMVSTMWMYLLPLTVHFTWLKW